MKPIIDTINQQCYSEYFDGLQRLFFILNIILLAINKGDTKDTEMEVIMDNIVESLFSVFVTLGE